MSDPPGPLRTAATHYLTIAITYLTMAIIYGWTVMTEPAETTEAVRRYLAEFFSDALKLMR